MNNVPNNNNATTSTQTDTAQNNGVAVDQNNTLNVQDLQNLLAIVDFGAQNGLYKGWDTISAVFALREKLYNFLKSVDPNLVTQNNATSAEQNQNVVNQNNPSNQDNANTGTQADNTTRVRRKK